MPYLNKLLAYNPVFYWVGPYAALTDILTEELEDNFPYNQGTLILWAKSDTWGGADSQVLIDFNRAANPYSDIRVWRSAPNTVACSYTAAGAGRTLSGSVSGSEWLPIFFQWDTNGHSLATKINFAAKQTLAVPLLGPMSEISLAQLIVSFTGQLQYIALYDTLLADEVLSDLEVMVADVGKSVFTLIDYDSEKTAVQIHHVALTAGNFAATETLLDALRDATAAITLGNMAHTRYGNEDLLSVTPASDEQAQREAKWLVSYHDTTSLKSYSVEIGTADFDQLDPNDRKHAHIGDAGLVDAFVTAFEAVAKSPTGGAVVVDEITLVGRNV